MAASRQRAPEFGGTGYCHIVDFEDRYRERKPILGYDQFRDVWLPLEEEPERDVASMGLLVQLGPGDVRRYSCNRKQVAVCRSRPVGHELQIPVLISLEGADRGALQVGVRRPEESRTVSSRRYQLSADRRVIRTRLDVPAGCSLVLLASTSDPAGHVEVRRYDPRLGDQL